MGLKNTYQTRKRFTKVPVSKTGMWYQDGDVVVPSNQITMKGPNGESDYFNSPIMGTGMQSGQTQVMYPGREYSFPNDNSVYETKMQGGGISGNSELALDLASMVPGPVGMIASGLGLFNDLYQGDWVGAGLNTANILTGGTSKGLMSVARLASNAGARNAANVLAAGSRNLNRTSRIVNNYTKPVDTTRNILNPSATYSTEFGGYEDNNRKNIPTRPDWYTTEDWDRSVDQYNFRNRSKMQDGGNVDPEFMFKNKYNTELTPSEEADFSKWAAKESQRQGRDILNDMGAYDVKGFWKSGDYKNMDSDNHGTDTWKKPNHPTFSNQSRYNGADGWYGGNWTDKAGYQPSKQTLETYGPEYYDWMFKSEPGRSEYLDMSRYESGANSPTPFVYQKGGRTPIYVSNPNDPRLKSYNDSLSLYNLNKNNIKDLKYIEDEYGYDRNLYDANWNKFTKNWDKTKGPKSTIAFDNLTRLNKEFPTPYRQYTSVLDSRNTVFEFKKPVQPIQYKPLQKQVAYPNQQTGRGMTRTISKNIEFKPDPKIVAKQQQLIDAGYNIGTADGIWGSKSQKAWNQMSTPKQSEVNMSFETPVMKVKGMTEENIGTLKKQYKDEFGTNFKSEDNIFNNLQKSLGRRPTVTEYNRAVQQYNNSNRSMKNGGWLDSYQEGGEVSTANNPVKMNPIDIQAPQRSWFDRNIERPLRKFGRSYAQRISNATGGSEWYKQPNSVASAFFSTGPGFALEAPQLTSVYAATGKVQTPSEAMNIQNPYGAFAVDMLLDPVGAPSIAKGIMNLGRNLPKKFMRSAEIPKTSFKSEIDWGKWNVDTPKYPELMNEYNTIEESTKKAGTWMKNPDGSPFVGSNPTKEELLQHGVDMTPEEAIKAQFIQQQSSFLKNYIKDSKLINPDGSPTIQYHGSAKKFDTFDESKFQLGDAGYSGSGIYTTPDKIKANSYARSSTGFHSGKIDPTVYHLYGQANNPISSEQLIKEGDLDLFNFHRKSAPVDQQLLNYDAAIHNQLRNVERIRSWNDAFEVVFPTNKQLKSAVGNVGFFDANSNIYKAVAPVGVGLGAGASQLQEKKYGGLQMSYLKTKRFK